MLRVELSAPGIEVWVGHVACKQMASTSVTKGKQGEREVVRIARTFGLDARRTAPLQAGRQGSADVTIEQAPHVHVEVKRDERLSVDAMVRQAVRDAAPEGQPCVIWRRNRGGWRADVPLDFFFHLLAKAVR